MTLLTLREPTLPVLRQSMRRPERAHRLTTQFVVPTTPGGEPVRRLRIVPPCQLELVSQPRPDANVVWASLPERNRETALGLLASMVATGIAFEDSAGGPS